MELLIATVNKLHVSLGWVSVLLIAVLFWRKKGDLFHRRLGKFTLVVTAFMSCLAGGFVIYRLFGGTQGPGGFSILGVNKLAFPLYMFFAAYLLVRRGASDDQNTAARKGAVLVMVIAVLAGTVAAVVSGNRPYFTGRFLYTLEINLTDFLVGLVVPFYFFLCDFRWNFSTFSRLERINQHALRMVIGTVFLIYASAPWNHFTNWVYSLFFGNLGLGHVLLYTGSPFLAILLVLRYNPNLRSAAFQHRGARHKQAFVQSQRF